MEFDFGEFVKSGLQEEVFEPFDIQGEVESSLMWTAIFSPSVKLDTQAISVVLLRSGGPYEAKTVEKQFEEVFLRLTRVQTEDVAGTLAIVTTVRLVNGQPMIDELHFSYAEDSGWIESDISVQPLVVRPPDDGH
ncbi:MAG: hypothetical protein HQ581_23650 [Planctomycetes bacterium]|nr:hypothetical protein [Planctomycetota bacterium]